MNKNKHMINYNFIITNINEMVKNILKNIEKEDYKLDSELDLNLGCECVNIIVLLIKDIDKNTKGIRKIKDFLPMI